MVFEIVQGLFDAAALVLLWQVRQVLPLCIPTKGNELLKLDPAQLKQILHTLTPTSQNFTTTVENPSVYPLTVASKPFPCQNGIFTLIKENGDVIGYRNDLHPDLTEVREGKHPGIFIKEEM